MYLIAIAPLPGHNFTSQLTAIAKIIQKLDTKSAKGDRAVLLSQHKPLLVGFSLNKKIAFESIVKPALPHRIDRLQGSAVVQIPDLLPGVNFSNPKSYSFYRFIINMGCVSDKWPGGFQPKGIDDGETVSMYSSWRPSFERSLAEAIQIQLSRTDALNDSTTIILSVGIQFGAALTDAI